MRTAVECPPFYPPLYLLLLAHLRARRLRRTFTVHRKEACDREHRLGQGASLGEEAVLADSGRAGEIAARAGRVRRATFSTAC
jgi:hypothetical protein